MNEKSQLSTYDSDLALKILRERKQYHHYFTPQWHDWCISEEKL